MVENSREALVELAERVERVAGFEPAVMGWKPMALPLGETRETGPSFRPAIPFPGAVHNNLPQVGLVSDAPRYHGSALRARSAATA